MYSNLAAEKASGLKSDFDGAIEAFRQASGPFLKGDPQPVTELFSRSDDVTLANPLGPPHRGPAEVDKRQLRQPPSLATAPCSVSRRCLDTARQTLATSSRLSGPRHG